MNIKRVILSLALAASFGALAAGGDYVDRSGTVATGGTSQTLAAATDGRGPIIITNPSTETEVLCVNLTSAASCSTPGSFLIQSGGSLTLNSNEAITVVAATSGHKYTAKERAIGASLIGGGGSGGSGTDPRVAQGSTTSGQTGSLVQGAVTTGSPTYTTGQTNPFSLDTSGNLRVNVVAGGAGGGNVTGGVAHDGVGTAVSPVLIGAYASAAAPTDVSADGDATRLWVLRNGAAAVQPTYAGILGLTGNGVTGTGSPRVTIASDNTPFAIKVNSGGIASGGVASGAVASGAVASGAFASGALASGSVASGAMVDLGAQADSVCSTDTGTCTLIALTKKVAQDISTDPTYLPTATAKIDVSTATTTQIVAASGSFKVKVAAFSIIAGGTGNIKFVYGTGSNCGTGTTDLTASYNLTAQSGLAMGAGIGIVLITPASQALCVTTSAAVQMSGFVTYAQN